MDVKQRRAIGRIITQASIFLLLGAIVNIAVAWAFALWLETGISVPVSSYEHRLPDKRDQTWWRKHSPEGFPDAPQSVRVMSQFGSLYTSLSNRDAGGSYFVYQIAYGVPMASMECADWEEPSRRIPDHRDAYEMIASRVLGLRPVWPGFAINTLFYAAILWLLFAAPFKLRRWRRIKRGLCPACAYPVGTSDVCTECGKPIPSSLRGRSPAPGLREGWSRQR